MANKYTDEEKREIVGKIIIMLPDMSLNQACNKLVVNKSTIWNWIVKDSNTKEQYERARSLYADNLFDKLMELSSQKPQLNSKGDVDNGAVNNKRAEMDVIKWALSKVRADKFGDRLQLAGDKDQPLKVIHEVERIVVDTNKDKLIGDSETGVGVEVPLIEK